MVSRTRGNAAAFNCFHHADIQNDFKARTNEEGHESENSSDHYSMLYGRLHYANLDRMCSG
jgi:hypothetical protein